VSAALGEFCGRKMPAETPALLGPLMDAEVHYPYAVWEEHYQHHADAEDHGWD
jgi:hypothetical protein